MADVTSPFGFPYPEDTDLVRDGASDIEALAVAVNDQFSAGFQYVGFRVFTSTVNFDKTDAFGNGTNIEPRGILVYITGGGGGGGGAGTTSSSQVSMGSGGAGGGTGLKFFGPTDIAGFTTSETVAIGLGGAGDPGTVFASGSTGGASSFAGITANGGSGGVGSVGDPGVFVFGSEAIGGTVSGASYGFTGSRGSIPNFRTTANFGFLGGGGGDSYVGNGAAGNRTNSGTAGQAGGKGAGGAGGVNSISQGTARAGGNGGDGLAIFHFFV
jgi:hypothetical protein